ncbi:MAG: helix-turn-helix domain-containing protein [Alistipes sp.]
MAKKTALPTVRIAQLARHESGGYLAANLAVSDDGWNGLEPFDHPVRLGEGARALYRRPVPCLDQPEDLRDRRARPDRAVFRSIVHVSQRSNDLSLRAVGFSIDFLKGVPQSVVPLYPYMFHNPVLPLSREDAGMLADYFDRLREKAARQNHLYTREITLQLLLSMFFEISALYQAKHPQDNRRLTRNEEIFKRLMQLIMHHYREQRATAFYARELCLTPKYLASVVKKISNRSVAEWIAEAVILDAKTQLRTSQMTVQQIANYLNFPNPSFFGPFQKHTGMTPKAYRLSE